MENLNQCTECLWIGKDEQLVKIPLNDSLTELVCPQCTNNEFFCKEVHTDHMQPVHRLCDNLLKVYEAEKLLLQQDLLDRKISEQDYSIIMALLEHDIAAIRNRTNSLEAYHHGEPRETADTKA